MDRCQYSVTQIQRLGEYRRSLRSIYNWWRKNVPFAGIWKWIANWIGEELTLTGNRNHRCFKIVLPFWGVGNIQRSGDIVTQGDRCWKSGRMNISPAALSPILCFTVLLMLLMLLLAITARLRIVLLDICSMGICHLCGLGLSNVGSIIVSLLNYRPSNWFVLFQNVGGGANECRINDRLNSESVGNSAATQELVGTGGNWWTRVVLGISRLLSFPFSVHQFQEITLIDWPATLACE